TSRIDELECQDRMDELLGILTQLDFPVGQVMIEERIVEANVGFDKALGVRWGGNVNLGNRFNAFGQNGTNHMGVAPDPNAQGKPGDENYIPSRTTAGFIGIPEVPLNIPFVDMGVI